MGVDVGVVTIEYLDQPPPPAYRFLEDLLLGLIPAPEDDDDVDEYDWGGDWANNSIHEFHRASLDRRANRWAAHNRLSDADQAVLRQWLDELPWQSDYITLHLGN